MRTSWLKTALVLLRRVGVERPRVGVAVLEEGVPGQVHAVDVVAVELLRLVARSGVVGVERGLAVAQEVLVLGREEVDLSCRQFHETPVAWLSQTRVRVRLLVRTWNVYHGRTHPPTSKLYLEEMVPARHR